MVSELVLEDRLEHFTRWLATKGIKLCDKKTGRIIPAREVYETIEEYVNE